MHQVRRPSWHNGRVVLLGDAAWCLTLYSGMGATAGLLGVGQLGEAFAAIDDLEVAFADYEQRRRPFVAKHQKAALFKAQIFVPSGLVLARLRRRLIRAGVRKRQADQAAVAGTLQAFATPTNPGTAGNTPPLHP